MKNNPTLYKLVSITVLLALVVVILGAYTRLTNAGLGCPDWPGCYGHIIAPDSQKTINQAEQAYPNAQVQETKAWTEMVHRYAAGTLVGLSLIITILLITRIFRRQNGWASLPKLTPLLLIALLLFQAVLGKWTVTWKLLPTVVMGHLLGGISILACLWLLRLQIKQSYSFVKNVEKHKFRLWALLGLMVVFCQIALGGWVSSNYAGIACIGFPLCNGHLWPQMNFNEAFTLLHPIGMNYQGGLLDSTARVTIQMVHRIGAFITLFYIGFLGIWIVSQAMSTALRTIAKVMLFLLAIQFILGIINVTALLPLAVAVAHNGIAALLLLSLISLNYSVWRQRQDAMQFA